MPVLLRAIACLFDKMIDLLFCARSDEIIT